MQEYVQTDIHLEEREWQGAPAMRSAPRIEETKGISCLTPPRSVYVIDFFEARQRLRALFEEESKESGIGRKADDVTARSLPSLGRIDRFEESLYWFLSAITVIYLLFVILA